MLLIELEQESEANDECLWVPVVLGVRCKGSMDSVKLLGVLFAAAASRLFFVKAPSPFGTFRDG